MNRLRDLGEGQGGDEPLFRRGVEILKKTPPTAPTADARLRVWLSIRRASGATSARGGLRPFFLKLAVAGVVALVAGTAGAVIARRWLVSRPDGVPAGATAVRAPRAASARPEAARPVPPIELAADVGQTGPGADEGPGPRPPRSAAKRPVNSTPPPAPAAAAAARERTEVLDALVALRREHDPVRAGALLTRYLSAHPRGTLREEALALAIEAADARGDRAAGSQLAAAYQSEFPGGRFLPFARSHTAGRTP